MEDHYYLPVDSESEEDGNYFLGFDSTSSKIVEVTVPTSPPTEQWVTSPKELWVSPPKEQWVTPPKEQLVSNCITQLNPSMESPSVARKRPFVEISSNINTCDDKLGSPQLVDLSDDKLASPQLVDLTDSCESRNIIKLPTRKRVFKKKCYNKRSIKCFSCKDKFKTYLQLTLHTEAAHYNFICQPSMITVHI